MTFILFVCLGNICRSPALEAIFKKMVKDKGLENQFFIDSCAWTSSFLGKSADRRIQIPAEKRGIVIETTAKLFEDHYLDLFDYIFAVDQSLVDSIKSNAQTSEQKNKVYLVTKFSKKYFGQDMPDPYLRGDRAFEKTLDMAEDACQGILAELLKIK